jgi:hypothetical protein
MAPKYIPLFLLLLAFKPPCCGDGKKPDVIFTGEVVQIKNVQETDLSRTIVFRVEKYIKGSGRYDTLEVETPNPPHHDWIFFKVKRKYEVHATVKGNKLITGACSGTLFL